MNVYQKLGTKWDSEQEKKHLELHGIQIERNKRKVKRRYRFFIYQLELVEFYGTVDAHTTSQPLLLSKSKQRVLWQKLNQKNMTNEMKKAKRLAMRALYVLGYDLGLVEVCVYHAIPRFAISKLLHDPQLERRMSSTIQRVTERIKNKDIENRVKESVLGADIEFVLRHVNGKYAIASDYFTRKGKVGYDAIWLKGKRNKHPLVELRPAPSTSPKKLFTNTYHCMQQAIKELNHSKLQWIAGGNPLKRYPIGGHIHFSKIQLTLSLLRALDNYLALPLCVMESAESHSRRPKYGFLGDFREKYHGGFEYRTPPSWIIHPVIAKGVLCSAKIIANDYQLLKWYPLDTLEQQQNFYNGRREELYPIVQALWNYLRILPSYESYRNDLEAYYHLIEKKYVWNEFDDIRMVWRLPPYHK